MEAIVNYTVGSSGSGKSYLRGVWAFLYEVLPGTGRMLTNVPIYPELLAQEAANRKLASFEEAMDRLTILPESIRKDWLPVNGGGPWDLGDISGCKLVIDEIHNFAPKGGNASHLRKWQEWIGELRHQGASVEFLTQDHYKVAPEIWHEAPIRLQLEPCWIRRDKVLQILMSDWYQLIAALKLGPYLERTWIIHQVKVGSVWTDQHTDKATLWPTLFKCYNSYSKPIQGGKSGGAKLREWQRHTLAGFLRWWLRNNWFLLFKRGVVPLVVLLVPCVGVMYVFDGTDWLTSRVLKVGNDTSAKVSKPEAEASLPIPSSPAAFTVATQPFTPQPVTVAQAPIPDDISVPEPVLLHGSPQSDKFPTTRPFIPRITMLTKSTTTLEGIVYALGDETPVGPLVSIDHFNMRAHVGDRWLYLSASSPSHPADIAPESVSYHPASSAKTD